MKNVFRFMAVVGILFLSACSHSSSTSSGGTSTVTLTDLEENFATAAGSLVPSITSGSSNSSLNSSLFLVTYSDTGFENFFESYQSNLSEIFGSADEEPAVVTKIRVTLENFIHDHVGTLAIADPDMDCTGSSQADEEGITISSLTDSDTVESAFLGAIQNGTSGDRFFDCYFEINDEESGSSTYVYGQDSDGNIHILSQEENRNAANEEQVETYGAFKTLVQVTYGIYHQTSGTETNTYQIDLQYAQASIYSGQDDSIAATEDNVLFKSRSRITGEAILNASDNSVTTSSGQFNIIKYDQSPNNQTSYSQAMGRGHFQTEGDFIFTYNFVSNETSQTDGAQTFCVNQTSSSTLALSDETDCEDFETELPYSSLSIEPVPALETAYEDNELFSPDDLISNDASDFIVPTYE